ncbi:hypothetical protein HZI73_02835 [Vallitalea pronyensis]|uniref:D-glucuronyl C5-epimerase C-terminal domain-containing protein n=1 Tax=Vallitalea pronyensis TaxID=1348613 RepID=A0A8J8SFI3_9FIRM|nr:hypothetical protein [Vallitalea pronyensis]QUI21283.1 hypothetical protein HZI73_02835 [Vallitalea pronyensis]
MQKRLLIILVVIILIGVVLYFTNRKEINEGYKKDTITVKQDNFTYKQQNITFNKQGLFFNRRIDYDTLEGHYTAKMTILGNKGMLYYFNENKELIAEKLKEGPLPMNTMFYIETDGDHYLSGQNYTYRDLGNGTKESIEEHVVPVHLSQHEDTWLVTYTFKLEKNWHGIMWGLQSPNQLIDLTNPENVQLWSYYDVDKKARFGEDGYYYKSPNSYKPTSNHAFWKNPAMYIVSSFTEKGGSLASDLLAQSWLIIAADNLNDHGYFPTLPQSDWLKNDYGIGAHFFDTRFNADIIETYLIAYQKFGHDIFRQVYLEAAHYYVEHAKNNHFTFDSEKNGEGWLVEDYYHEIDNLNPTHTSLNHQLQAINMFLLLYEEEENQEYLVIAEYMLKGIKNTLDCWIMEDHNLEYAYLPDGTMGFVDYPYLTYNDLFKSQELLTRINGEGDEDLDYLMRAKKIWMDDNGITGYEQ